MDTWYSKRLGTFRTAFGALNEIQQQFLACYMASGRSEGVAIFVEYSSAQDSVTAYLTPESSKLAGRIGASVCAAPVADASLLIGDRNAYQQYFRSIPQAREEPACN